MGRPRKAPDERKDARLPAPRVTSDERAFVEAQALAAGLDVAEFIRRRALGRKIDPARSVADERLLLEINRIGVNLNQLTARANATGELPDGLADTLAEVQAAMERVAAHGS